MVNPNTSSRWERETMADMTGDLSGRNVAPRSRPSCP